MFNLDYLKKVSLWEAQKTLAVIKQAKEEKTVHRHHKKGWTDDRGMRRSAKIPLWVLDHREYGKYFSPSIPWEDRQKESNKFLKLKEIKTPWGEKISPEAFLLVDKL